MKKEEYNLFTQKIINRLPYWMSIRKKNDTSIGSRFLNVFGIELNEMYDLLNYAYEQVYIDSIDTDQVNILYKVCLDSYIDINEIEGIYTPECILNETDNLKELSSQHDKYLIDKKRNIIYFSKNHMANNKNKYGQVTIRFKNHVKTFKLEIHHVWNFLDEFGYLLDCRRITGESNLDYKNRLIDVFKSPPHSTRDGLLNAISRELGIRKFKIWEDGSEDFTIEDNMVVINKIKVDNKYIDLKDIRKDEYNNIILIGKEEFKGQKREVVYDSGIEMHQMFNKEDERFQSELFDNKGFAKKKLIEYSHILKKKIPILWNEFIFDEAFFDLNAMDISGEGFIPTRRDAKIDGFTEKKDGE